MGTKIFDRWLSHPTDRSKDFAKLHGAIDDRGAAFSITITDGTTSDITLLPYLLNDIDAHMGVVRADKGYLSKDNVQRVSTEHPRREDGGDVYRDFLQEM